MLMFATVCTCLQSSGIDICVDGIHLWRIAHMYALTSYQSSGGWLRPSAFVTGSSWVCCEERWGILCEQVDGLSLYYGPDTYMGENLVALFNSLANMSDDEIRGIHKGGLNTLLR